MERGSKAAAAQLRGRAQGHNSWKRRGRNSRDKVTDALRYEYDPYYALLNKNIALLPVRMPREYHSWVLAYGVSADPLAMTFIEAIDVKRTKVRFLMRRLFNIAVPEAVKMELFIWNLYLTMTKTRCAQSGRFDTAIGVDQEAFLRKIYEASSASDGSSSPIENILPDEFGKNHERLKGAFHFLEVLEVDLVWAYTRAETRVLPRFMEEWLYRVVYLEKQEMNLESMSEEQRGWYLLSFTSNLDKKVSEYTRLDGTNNWYGALNTAMEALRDVKEDSKSRPMKDPAKLWKFMLGQQDTWPEYLKAVRGLCYPEKNIAESIPGMNLELESHDVNAFKPKEEWELQDIAVNGLKKMVQRAEFIYEQINSH